MPSIRRSLLALCALLLLTAPVRRLRPSPLRSPGRPRVFCRARPARAAPSTAWCSTPGSTGVIYGRRRVARSVVHGSGFSPGLVPLDDAIDYFFGYDRPFLSSLAAAVDLTIRSTAISSWPTSARGSRSRMFRTTNPANPRRSGQWRGPLHAAPSVTSSSTIDPAAHSPLRWPAAAITAPDPAQSGRRNVFDITSRRWPPALYLLGHGVMIATVAGGDHALLRPIGVKSSTRWRAESSRLRFDYRNAQSAGGALRRIVTNLLDEAGKQKSLRCFSRAICHCAASLPFALLFPHQ